ncbi:MAG: hypothetical protein AAGI68_11830 [Planctomycetota bacterium]
MLFTDQMVRAILEGRKTQTRRLVTASTSTVGGHTARSMWARLVWNGLERVDPGFPTGEAKDFDYQYLKVPYWEHDRAVPAAVSFHEWYAWDGTSWRVYSRVAPGGVLWVRETWQQLDDEHGTPLVAYRADNTTNLVGRNEDGRDYVFDAEPGGYELSKWKPSIFMPRWACRLELDVVSVRPERLHDISEEDAIAEGVWFDGIASGYCVEDPAPTVCHGSAVLAFQGLWDSINGDRAGASWFDNPWVWVIEFEPRRLDGKRIAGEVGDE